MHAADIHHTVVPNNATFSQAGMAAIGDGGWMSARKPTTRPTGPVRNGFVVENAPECDKRRIRALQNKRYRRSPAYKRHLEARKVDVVYRWRVFKEQARRRNISVSISFDAYSSIVRTACWYCDHFTYKGYSGVDRVDNTGTYQKDNVVACCKTCNFMKWPLSVEEFLGKVKQIAREQPVSVE